jgi:transposase-like protein
MAKELDDHVESFRTRPLNAGPYTFLAADALVLKAREGSLVVHVHALLATGVNAEAHREILGLDVASGVRTAPAGRAPSPDPVSPRPRPVMPRPSA